MSTVTPTPVPAGSSPRTWGTPQKDRLQDSHGRFIPTHVGNTRASGHRPAGAAVHPHARGEHTALRGARHGCSGSSPRTWGTRARSIRPSARSRFIPTHVGNTATEVRSFYEQCGSSPRTWGTHCGQIQTNGARRFIPTHVGNTASSARVSRLCPVHPHARGEHSEHEAGAHTWPGSSPRTWGTQHRGRAQGGAGRFIPTHVGNTPSCAASKTAKAVHPHARGEHRASCRAKRSCSGSSPRTWGTLGLKRGHVVGHRFIPTHVGNTCACTGRTSSTTVHPHARGEHPRFLALAPDPVGSSPRTWGTLPAPFPCRPGFRFIPTHVGNTSGPAQWSRVWTVHPHARGEHKPTVWNSVGSAGSSPRTWGTLPWLRARVTV